MLFSTRTQKMCSGIAAICVGLAGCATSSKDVATAYVSPIQYQTYDCDQLSAEAVRVQARVTQLGGRLDEAAASDKALTGVALILFWPAAFALGGTKGQEAEYARLKGEYEAIVQQATVKKCTGLVPITGAAAPRGTQSKPEDTVTYPGATKQGTVESAQPK